MKQVYFVLDRISVVAMLILVFGGIAFGQSYYYYYKGTKVYLQKSDGNAIVQVAERDRVTVDTAAKSAGMNMKGEVEHGRGLFWLESPNKHGIDLALGKLQVLHVIRTFPTYYSVKAGGDIYEYPLFDEFIVKFHSNLSRSEIDEVNGKHGVEVLEVNPYGEYILRVKESSSYNALDLANRYYEDNYADWSEPNFVADIKFDDDPLYGHQWYLKNTGQILNSIPGVDIDAPDVWTYTMGSSSTIVAVIDDGVESHEDLPSDHILSGYTVYGGNGSPSQHGFHGEAVAGIIAAQHNGIGIEGIAPNVKILPINIDPGTAGWAPNSEMAKAIDTARVRGAAILNVSWHTYQSSDITAAINRAIYYPGGRGGKGCICVASAGNTGSYTEFPRYYPVSLRWGQ